ncbi:hypothetical protein P3W53_10170, partial [Pseudomonas denitrificans (nom. rej.)]|nr:hypothetical protein [Pseudomonas denitrificans (nom. rej.)]
RDEVRHSVRGRAHNLEQVMRHPSQRRITLARYSPYGQTPAQELQARKNPASCEAGFCRPIS